MPSTQEHLSAAVALIKQGRAHDSWDHLKQALEAKPDHEQAREAVLLVAAQTGRTNDAIALLSAAASARRSVPGLQRALATLFLQAGQFEDAERALRKALTLEPGSALSHMFLGIALTLQGRADDGHAAARRACELDPKTNAAASIRFWCCLGDNRLSAGRVEEAVQAFRRAVEFDPNSPEALACLARALRLTPHLAEALDAAERAARLGPRSAAAHAVFGNILINVGRSAQGCEELERALELNPGSRDYRSVLLMGLNYSSSDGKAIRAAHRAQGQHIEGAVAPLPPAPSPRTDGPLRVGFMSGDLREHACARFLAPLFDRANRDALGFTLVGIPTANWQGPMTEWFREASDEWVSIAGIPTTPAAERIREAGIDVLIDCSGHTDYNRLDVCAASPAPVQVTFLGYPATTGLQRIHARFVDEITDPMPAADAFAEERLIRIPECLWCFRPSETSPSVGPAPLENGGRVTIGCFNNMAKFTAEAIDAWAEILRRVPNATLLCKNLVLHEPRFLATFRDKFSDRGIDPARVEAVPYAPSIENHLRVYDLIDFQVDPFPYNGTTTTCESLWQGVPVVAVEGKVHAARVSKSLLHAVGLDDLVAPSVQQYVDSAVRLASDPDRLRSLRTGMRDRMRSGPLRAESAYCGRFAAAVRTACDSPSRV